MILTPHAIIGATLANIFPNEPALGFGAAFFSHYVLDLIPHADYEIGNFLDKDTKTVKSIKNNGAILHLSYIFFDLLIAIIICAVLFVRDQKSALITFVGIIGGLLPDLFQLLYHKYKNEPWIFFQKVHDRLHNADKMKDRKALGFFIQFFLIVLFLIGYILLKKYI